MKQTHVLEESTFKIEKIEIDCCTHEKIANDSCYVNKRKGKCFWWPIKKLLKFVLIGLKGTNRLGALNSNRKLLSYFIQYVKTKFFFKFKN